MGNNYCADCLRTEVHSRKNMVILTRCHCTMALEGKDSEILFTEDAGGFTAATVQAMRLGAVVATELR
jgi:hypothetical protein